MAQRVHLPNFSTLPQCALLAIAERRSQLARAVANRFAVEKVYSSHLELAADVEIDAVAQQYSHNLNLLRFILEADQQPKTRVETVSPDVDGITGLTVLHLSGIRSTLETATSKFHGWDEQTQIYFEGGWLSEQIYKKYLGIT